MSKPKRVLLLFIFMAGVVGRAQGPAHSVLDLGSLGGGETFAHGINAEGDVVGASVTAAGHQHAFLWDFQTRTIHDLGTLGGANSIANGINDAGRVVGRSEDASGNVHAFLYESGQGLVDLHQLLSLGGLNSTALAVNNVGQIVGGAEDPDGAIHAVRLDLSTGVTTDLGRLPDLGDASIAFGINDVGDIVGDASTETIEFHAFRYTTAVGQIADIGTLGGAKANLRGVANTRVGYGASTTSVGSFHAIAVSLSSGALTDLGTLGGQNSAAYGGNSAGVIVGQSDVPLGIAHAFSHYGGSLHDLNALAPESGWILTRATAINDAGLIIGDGLLNGERRSFLLLPPDNTAPLVTAPAPITVEGTEIGGTRSSSSIFLEQFLAGGSATDNQDPDPLRLSPRANGQDVTSATFFPLGTTTVSFRFRDSSGNFGAASSTVTVGDHIAPTVIPPAAVTVPVTEGGGAKGSASSALSAFLAGGTAVDLVDPAPVRLSPQVAGANVGNGFLFPVGTTNVTFRFRDARGNTGTAVSTVTVTPLPPQPRLLTYNYVRFYNLPDDPSTYACSSETGVPCDGSVLAPNTNWTVNYHSKSSADWGVLRAYSRLNLTGDGSLGPLNGGSVPFPNMVSVGGRAGFRDAFMTSGGTGSGTLFLQFTITGSSSQASGGLGRTVFQRVPIVAGREDWAHAVSYPVLTGPTGTQTATVPLSFTFGQSLEFEIQFYALAQILSAAGWNVSATATADYLHTVTLTSISATDPSGNPIPSLQLTSSSGAQYDAGGAFKKISIDVKPGPGVPTINARSRGQTAVAVLSSADFNALAVVDRESLTFGKTGFEDSLVRCNADGEDVDDNGLLDLICHFETTSTRLDPNDTLGELRGRTLAGMPIRGSDQIRVTQ